jgi:hypothetical protein
MANLQYGYCDFKLERVHMATPLRPVSGGQSCPFLEKFLLPLPAQLVLADMGPLVLHLRRRRPDTASVAATS